MISISEVLGTESTPIIFDPIYLYEKESNDIMDDLNRSYNEYTLAIAKADFFNEFFEANEDVEKKDEKASENKEVVIKKSNFVEKLGATIIKLFNSFMTVINKIIDNIKNSSFRAKSELQKVESAIKQHPELKDRILEGFEKGELDIKDVQSVAEMDKAIDDMIESYKKNNRVPDTLEAKWDALSEKSKKAVKLATAVGTGMAALYAIPKLINEVGDAATKHRERTRKQKSDLEWIVSHIQSKDKDGNTIHVENDKTGNVTHLLNLWNVKNNRAAACFEGTRKPLEGVLYKAAGIVDSIGSTPESIKKDSDRREINRVANTLLASKSKTK